MNIAGAIEYLGAGLSPVTEEHLTEAEAGGCRIWRTIPPYPQAA